MHIDQKALAQTAMLIRRPVAEAFRAFVDPEITTKFWFTKSTGMLEKGESVQWIWEMYDVTSYVKVLDLVPDQRILIEWGPEKAGRSRAEWTFEAVDGQSAFVSIAMDGFTGDEETVLKNIVGSVGGFCWVLAGCKAYLEHGLQLNLVGDRFPQGK